MAYNYGKLRGRIVEICHTQREFAKQMELSERSITLRMHGKIAWDQKDIAKALDVLKLSERDIRTYFFAE